MTADRTTPWPVRWITQAAFLLCMIVIIARFTTPDVLRDPWEAIPGSDAVPAGAGPASGLVFDLLAVLPALLVLLRRSIDSNYRLSMRWSHWLLFALTGWAVLSTAWAADRFASAVTSAHFFAAGCLLWAMAQIVRSAGRLRLVSALSLGLLLVLVVQSVIFRFVDVPENLNYWQKNKESILKAHNWMPDSFPARQFEQKLTSGELVGVFNSPNSVAAVGVLLFFACVGIGIQKYKDKAPREWLVLPVIAAISLIWILFNARSKTSAATPFVGLAILAMLILFSDSLLRHRKRVYFAGVGFVAFAIIAIIGHGLYHRNLFAGHFSNSLDFRWKYWVASTHIFTAHPWIGVGWDNFGLHYLAHRLPEAAEEIRDPHNFLVHFAVELGAVGLLLCVAWMLRLAWELTTAGGTFPHQPTEVSEEDQLPGVRSICIAISLAMLVSVLANFDFSLPFVDLLNVLMKPMLYLLALIMGTVGGAMLSPQEWSLDIRPAPWVLRCTVIGLGLFLLHNLIDFSLFEANGLFVFMALIGASQGATGPVAEEKSRRGYAIGAIVSGGVAWLVAAVLFVGPIVAAESVAALGTEKIRTAPPERSNETAQHYRHAADDFATAAGMVPYNSDYLYRQARATAGYGDFPHAEAILTAARQVNPMLIDTYLLDANIQLGSPHPDVALVRQDFATITKLNPNDVSLHMQFAEALDRFNLKEEARLQYLAALNANAALPIGEPKRLTPAQVTELQNRISSH